MQLADFHMRHKGETALVCGVGPNLTLTPPWWFDHPSFGVNTIYRAAWDWEPTYFVGVDERLRLDDGPAICSRYADVQVRSLPVGEAVDVLALQCVPIRGGEELRHIGIT